MSDNKEPDSEYKTMLVIDADTILLSPHSYTVKSSIEYYIMGRKVVQFKLLPHNGPLQDYRTVSLT